MHRRLVWIPIIAAVVATVLLVAQGGFGAGHGAFDRAIWILGLPASLLVEWVPAPRVVERHDLLLMVWWPAIWNVLLWAGVVEVLMRLRVGGAARAKRTEAPRRSAGVYLHPDGFILHAQHRAVSGVLLSAPPVVRLPPHASDAELGAALLEVLRAFEEGVPHPARDNWKERAAAFLKETGYRTWRALEGPARSCWIDEEQGGLIFTPLRNGGSSGERKGFQPIDAEPVMASAVATDEEVGEALKRALAVAE